MGLRRAVKSEENTGLLRLSAPGDVARWTRHKFSTKYIGHV
jgi:hypothetical protein